MTATGKRIGVPVPPVSEEVRRAAVVFGRYCASWHMLDGEGGAVGPDLTGVGSKHDAKYLRQWIAQPEAIDPAASMPAFGEFLTEEEMTAIGSDLAARK